MKVSIYGTVETDEGSPPSTVPLGVIEREATADPGSGMGLWIDDAHRLMQRLQSIVIDEQALQFTKVAARCLACHEPLGVKDNKTVVYRTAFGKKVVPSPRFYSTCSDCGFRSGDGVTVSPLANALKERTPPQWSWLQCR
jgi:hypothetical protein